MLGLPLNFVTELSLPGAGHRLPLSLTPSLLNSSVHSLPQDWTGEDVSVPPPSPPPGFSAGGANKTKVLGCYDAFRGWGLVI